MTSPDWRTGDPLDPVALALEEGRTDDAIRLLVGRGFGREAIADRLQWKPHAVRKALERLDLRGTPGRRPGPARRALSVYLSDDERAELDAAAGEQGVGAWLREVGLRAARGG